MSPIVEPTWPRPPAQLFQLLSQLNSVLFTSIHSLDGGFSGRTTGSISNSLHPPRRIQSIRLMRGWASSSFKGATYYATRQGCGFNKKLSEISMRRNRNNHSCEGRAFFGEGSLDAERGPPPPQPRWPKIGSLYTCRTVGQKIPQFIVIVTSAQAGRKVVPLGHECLHEIRVTNKIPTHKLRTGDEHRCFLSHCGSLPDLAVFFSLHLGTVGQGEGCEEDCLVRKGTTMRIETFVSFSVRLPCVTCGWGFYWLRGTREGTRVPKELPCVRLCGGNDNDKLPINILSHGAACI